MEEKVIMGYSIFTDTMADMSWKEIETKGKAGVPILFPLGVIEQHGPHLPLGTDIYYSYAICHKIREKALEKGKEVLIAPPYYWGINHCTGAFPGTFSLKPDTMKLVLADIFQNFSMWGFRKIYCINYHGDPLHIRTILEAASTANREYGMEVRLLMEPYELAEHGLSGEEDYCMVDGAEYPPELFENDGTGLDIHAGAFETATIKHFYSDMPDEELAKKLPDCSLNDSTIQSWFAGGEEARKVVPFGYAGNPAGYEKQQETVGRIYEILCEYVADKI